ncbi:MAG TPA: hypothetical protein VKT78_19810, partial [Fimbriimonadaceae bacterium]|nr:hypothetical protein [Fimbriimonadaceae bacterium]
MIPSLLLLAMTQGDVRPNTLPPMAELKDETSFLGSIAGISFSPDYGGLPIIHDRHWSVSRSRAGDNGLIVNLRTGELSYVTAPDYMDRQVLCPDAMFVRSYRSELAKLGKRSPGLPYGWVHNYDLIIKLPSGAEKWEPVTLTYPNKSQELIEPQFNEKGEATGWGKSLSNATYDVGMVPGAAINTYKSISIRWPRTQVTWTFEPHESGVMVLSSVDHGRDIQG